MTKNVLWIMSDQLRYNYLSCYGAKHIDTPNIDRLASRGVRFKRAYVQSPVCGPSRASFYTGRYMRSHGATWNGFPLPVGQPTLGEHMREIGVSCSLVGKSHMVPDRVGMTRLGIDPKTAQGRRIAAGGFDEIVRDDGTNHTDYPGRKSPEDYDKYLRDNGMDGDNPWEEWANTGIDADGKHRSGWLLENARLPARVPKEYSETAWLTTRGIEFIEGQGDDPWLMHLSYIKPHWPYIAPAPYNDMYDAKDMPPAVRGNAERQTDHPLLRSWMGTRISESFSRDEARDLVGPTYMGLIKELDDQLGRLFEYLRENGRMDDTMIVFCSDHGDNIGDHWLGEKDLFYDCSARVPLIVYDPRPEADGTRGSASGELVEAIDLVPTFLDFYDAKAKPHILEGRSLQPMLHGTAGNGRDYIVSEYDYATRLARRPTGVDQADARMCMIFDGRWKYIHVETMRPMLFDLESDPDELSDLGSDPAYQDQVDRLRDLHFDWTRQHHARISLTAEQIEGMTDEREPPGILIAYWNQDELEVDGLELPDHVRE